MLSNYNEGCKNTNQMTFISCLFNYLFFFQFEIEIVIFHVFFIYISHITLLGMRKTIASIDGVLVEMNNIDIEITIIFRYPAANVVQFVEDLWIINR